MIDQQVIKKSHMIITTENWRINSSTSTCDDIVRSDHQCVEITKWNFGRLGNNILSAKAAIMYGLSHGCNIKLPPSLVGLY